MSKQQYQKAEEMLGLMESAIGLLNHRTEQRDLSSIQADIYALLPLVSKKLAIPIPDLAGKGMQDSIEALNQWMRGARKRMEELSAVSGFKIIRQEHNDALQDGLATGFLENYIDYPAEIIIETTGVCNAHCIFCPHENLPRKNLYMDDALFDRILCQLQEIPRDRLFRISPFKVNELFMDKQIFERIQKMNEMLPNAFIRIFSNLNSATPEGIERICNIRNISDINISLNSLDPLEYKELMGLNLERTLRNIRHLIDIFRAGKIKMIEKKIEFSRVSISKETDLAYLRTFQELFSKDLDIVEARVLIKGEWIDYKPSNHPLHQNEKCSRWAEINICCDGRVAFCCMDGKCDYFIGDVKKNSVLEIYNSPAYRSLREETILKYEVEPCKSCSLT